MGLPTARSRVFSQAQPSSSTQVSPAHESENAIGYLRGSCSPQLLFPLRYPGLAYELGGLWPKWAACPPVTIAPLSLGRG